MRRVSILLILIVSIQNALSESAIQNDWSGGAGEYGYSIAWSNHFYHALYLDYTNNSVGLMLTKPSWFSIKIEYQNVHCICAGDVDGDEDIDIIGGSKWYDDIKWWENLDGTGQIWEEHLIDEEFAEPWSIISVDINGDSQLDVVSAGVRTGLSWWENLTPVSDSTWIEHPINNSLDGAGLIQCADIDIDGDIDIVGTGNSFSEIVWWENKGEGKHSWIMHVITDDCHSTNTLSTGDLDNDGDTDVVALSIDRSEVSWWENDRCADIWLQHEIASNFEEGFTSQIADLNQDGYLDVLACSYGSESEFLWWENDGSGDDWSVHLIDTSSCVAILAIDFDVDGDLDILGSDLTHGQIIYWENKDSFGTRWMKRILLDNISDPRSLSVADINNDGSIDLISNTSHANRVSWWDNTEYSESGYLYSCILDTQTDPRWQRFTWYADVPEGTSISFNVRSWDTQRISGTWSERITEPCFLFDLLDDGDQYFQYRVNFHSKKQVDTPKLYYVEVTWEPIE